MIKFIKTEKGITVAEIIQIIIAILALVAAWLAVNSWRDEKEFDIKMEAKSNIPKLLNIANSLFTDTNSRLKKYNLTFSDSLILANFKHQFTAQELVTALNNRNDFKKQYSSLFNDIIDCEIVLSKLSNGFNHNNVIINQNTEDIELDRDIQLYSAILLKIDSAVIFDRNISLIENKLIKNLIVIDYHVYKSFDSSIRFFLDSYQNNFIDSKVHQYSTYFNDKINQLNNRDRIDHPMLSQDPIHPRKVLKH